MGPHHVVSYRLFFLSQAREQSFQQTSSTVQVPMHGLSVQRHGICAVHVVMNHGIIMQPSPFDPPLKIYGSRKFDGHYSSDSSEELFSGSEEDVYRFQPVDSTRLPHKKMLRYPQAKTKKHASKGICPRYVKGKCNRRGCCPFSHSLVGVKAEKDKQRYQTRRNGQRYQTRQHPK